MSVHAKLKALCVILISACVNLSAANYFDSNYFMGGGGASEKPRTVSIKQGVIQGVVVNLRLNQDMFRVEQYLGIPYAAPPINNMRFMPPNSAPSWTSLKIADKFGPVCPQKFPDVRQMTPERQKYFLKLKKYLVNESEDCLYLNLYVPYQKKRISKYPVMVFIHGESFEWNSGNPYNGSVLAAYGKVIVVTLNYRLGVLGFLKAGIEETSRSNFGLLDQVAALLWIQENIAAFDGDPDFVTVFGHGTGAVCASLLMLSPMVQQERNKMLFQRAILMGGTALADWALAGDPRQVTYQVAQSLNCQIHDDLAQCLRNRNLKDIMNAAAETAPFVTRFGPVVDGLVVPNDPEKLMTTYNNLFARFELMYGVTEIESIHLLGPVALIHGMLEKERDEELRKYMRARYERKPELCVTRTLAEYNDLQYSINSGKYAHFTDESDRASTARDTLLDILSDARTVAPVILTAKYHAAVNPQSYFYVFAHTTSSKEYIRNKTHHGEELPYVFGVPLGGSRNHFVDYYYNDRERLFSEVIMTYMSNFATTGDPNVPRKDRYYTLRPKEWMQFDIDWPEFDVEQQRYIYLQIPPQIDHHYREDKVNFWNMILPQFVTNYSLQEFFMAKPTFKPPPEIKPTRKLPFWLTKPVSNPEDYEVSPGNIIGGNVHSAATVIANSDPVQQSSTMQTLLVAGTIFLVINVILFVGLYYKCSKLKKQNASATKRHIEADQNENGGAEKRPSLLWQVMNIRTPKSRDNYNPLKQGDSTPQSKYTLPREMSASTIDAHTKVRDWIAQEIVQKYSPRYLRKPRRNLCDQIKLEDNPNVNENESKTTGSNLTIGRTPTRPVSPVNTKSVDIKNVRNTKKGHLKRSEKVSVAIDATPSGRGPSVLCQQPIELTKSLDYPQIEPDVPLRRSVTMDDVHFVDDIAAVGQNKNKRKSTTNIHLQVRLPETEVVKIEHHHSKSDPVQDIYDYSPTKFLKTFEPSADINVTSRDENERPLPLTPEEALMTIKRRNFPKVLPDLPSREAMAQKRRSMPATSNNPYLPTNKYPLGKTFSRIPPAPPPRTTSTKPPAEPVLAAEPPPSPEPEVTYNNLYVGPLIPTKNKKQEEDCRINIQPIYETLNPPKENKDDNKEKATPKTIISADSTNPIKRADPKVIIKPNQNRPQDSTSTKNKTIPRVMAKDNMPNTSGTLPRTVEKNEKGKEFKNKEISIKDMEKSKSNDNKNKVIVKNTKETELESEHDKEKKTAISKETLPEDKAKCSGKDAKESEDKASNKHKSGGKPSQIPTLQKTGAAVTKKESSSSESTPSSEESDTGTVVKVV